VIGAIADKKLVGTATATKVATLLDGLTLEQAALLPDTIKGFDANPDAFVLQGHPGLTTQLRDYLKANPRNAAKFNHRSYHFTDVPVEGSSTYESGTVGRPDIDVVHTVKFCIGVLKGTESDVNPRMITKPVALILLAHFTGDLHQPLHVGAEYFADNAKPMNPDVDTGQSNDDRGGNNLSLHLRNSATGHFQTAGELHGYWDDKAVDSAFELLQGEIMSAGRGGAGVSDADVATFLAGQTPTGFAIPTSAVETWSVDWANEILPLARDAHARLEFSHMLIHNSNHSASGQALEKAVAAGTDSYVDFAGKVTRTNLHKAGWRLALVVEKSLP
jgi:hypothetical protein